MNSDDSPPSPLAALSEDVAKHRARFLQAVETMRPRLHRYCTRMMGSVLDGEDVVQEALGQAFYRLHTLDDASRLESWLFRIAHNKALDHLRRRRDEAQLEDADEPEAPEVVDPVVMAQAMERMVTRLPPKERACVLLKDVLGYPLEDIANIVDSTVGGVKAALHRGRGKLATARDTPSPQTPTRSERHLIEAYVAQFNRRDWDGVKTLLRADARLEVVDRAALAGRDAIAGGYFRNYQALPWAWRLRLSRVDNTEWMLVHWREVEGVWRPHAPVELRFEQGGVAHIRDFVHVEYLFAHASVVDIHEQGETDG